MLRRCLLTRYEVQQGYMLEEEAAHETNQDLLYLAVTVKDDS